MNIFTTIYKTASDFERDTGKKPTKVYLGHNEWLAAKMAKDAFCHWRLREDNQRPEINGLTVYEVDAYDHLTVGV